MVGPLWLRLNWLLNMLVNCTTEILHYLFPATRDTIQLSKKMADAGADAVLVTTPCFYKTGMTNEAMVAHYTKVQIHVLRL